MQERDPDWLGFLPNELPFVVFFALFHCIRFETVVDGVKAFSAWVRSRAKT